MTVGSVLFSVLFYLLYLPYAQAAAAEFPDADRLASFFGLFWAGVTGLSFLVSVFFSNRLLRAVGATAVVLVLPVLYVGAFGITAIAAGFATLVAVRFVLGTWLQSAASPAWESLINVTPAGERDQVRAFLNGAPTQAGTALAGVVGLLGQQTLSTRQLAVVGLVVAAITVVVAWRIRATYITALLHALRVGRPVVFDAPVAGAAFLPDIGPTEARLLIDASLDPDPTRRRIAVWLLTGVATPEAAERLRASTDDPDPTVRATAAAALR